MFAVIGLNDQATKLPHSNVHTFSLCDCAQVPTNFPRANKLRLGAVVVYGPACARMHAACVTHSRVLRASQQSSSRRERACVCFCLFSRACLTSSSVAGRRSSVNISRCDCDMIWDMTEMRWRPALTARGVEEDRTHLTMTTLTTTARDYTREFNQCVRVIGSTSTTTQARVLVKWPAHRRCWRCRCRCRSRTLSADHNRMQNVEYVPPASAPAVDAYSTLLRCINC